MTKKDKELYDTFPERFAHAVMKEINQVSEEVIKAIVETHCKPPPWRPNLGNIYRQVLDKK